MIELVSAGKISKLSPNDKINIGIDSDFIRDHKITEKRKVGSLGEIISQEGPIYTIKWENGIVSKVHAQIDMIRNVRTPVLVYRPGSNLHLSDWEIADWANEVNHFKTNTNPYNKNICMNRLHSRHCSCGVNSDGYSLGVFNLMPMNTKTVQDMGLAYMVCRNCGEVSHL
jgi:hypothetical protein